MYLSNKYSKCYFSIINKAKTRSLDASVYVEKHHIVPKSLGGNNDPANLVNLTAREHLLCHRLLVKMTEGVERSKMAFAAWRMVFMGNKHKRHIVTSRVYESIKLEMAIARRNSKGSYKHSLESKEKISKGNKGKRLGKSLPPEWREKIGDSRRGEVRGPLPKSTTQKISESLTGKKREAFPESHKSNISAGRIGKRQYNNGINSILCFPGTEPEGYVLGRLSQKA